MPDLITRRFLFTPVLWPHTVSVCEIVWPHTASDINIGWVYVHCSGLEWLLRANRGSVQKSAFHALRRNPADICCDLVKCVKSSSLYCVQARVRISKNVQISARLFRTQIAIRYELRKLLLLREYKSRKRYGRKQIGQGL